MSDGSQKLYVLQLKDGMYYVGKAKNVVDRLLDHICGEGSEITKIFPVIDIIEVRNNCKDGDENNLVREYMAKYGIENVRGGAYCQLELKPSKIECLTDELNHDAGKCFRCGSKSHMVNSCPVNQSESSSSQPPPNQNVTGRKRSAEERFCSRCGHNNHLLPRCKATFTRNRDYAERDNEFCSRCGVTGHAIEKCYVTRDVNGNKL